MDRLPFQSTPPRGSDTTLPAIHPGEYLAEILDETGMSQSELADKTDIPLVQVSLIVSGEQPVTTAIAEQIGKVFGQTPQYWMNLQTLYESRKE